MLILGKDTTVERTTFPMDREATELQRVACYKWSRCAFGADERLLRSAMSIRQAKLGSPNLRKVRTNFLHADHSHKPLANDTPDR